MTKIYDELNTAISMCKEGSDVHDLLVAVSDALLTAEAERDAAKRELFVELGYEWKARYMAASAAFDATARTLRRDKGTAEAERDTLLVALRNWHSDEYIEALLKEGK